MISLRPLFWMLVVFSFISTFRGFAQTTVNYDYDASGNRIKRYLHVTPVETTKSAIDSSKYTGLANNSTSESHKDILTEVDGSKKITIYPNPTKGQLLIETSGYEKETKTALYLYSLKGALLESRTAIGSTALLDLSTYPRGTYLLKLMLGSKVSEWKIVKE